MNLLGLALVAMAVYLGFKGGPWWRVGLAYAGGSVIVAIINPTSLVALLIFAAFASGEAALGLGTTLFVLVFAVAFVMGSFFGWVGWLLGGRFGRKE